MMKIHPRFIRESEASLPICTGIFVRTGIFGIGRIFGIDATESHLSHCQLFSADTILKIILNPKNPSSDKIILKFVKLFTTYLRAGYCKAFAMTLFTL